YFEVLRNRRLAHGEGFGELRDRSLAPRQARQDGAARWISERSKGGVESISGVHCTTSFEDNHMVIQRLSAVKCRGLAKQLSVWRYWNQRARPAYISYVKGCPK